MRQQRNVAVEGRWRDLLLAPALVEHVAEVEYLELHGDTLAAELGKGLANGKIDPLEERLATGQFMAPMGEERVTLVTCWPYGVDDHRLIVVAKPVPSKTTSPPPAQ